MKFIKNLNYKKILSLCLNQDGSPFFNAKGLAIGVFSGCFPFFGLQTLIGLFLAKLFKGNLLLAALGTWISNPLTYVPLYYFNYKVGAIFLKSPPNISFEKNMGIGDLWDQGSIFSIRLIIGSSFVGLFLALISGTIVFWIYKLKKKR